MSAERLVEEGNAAFRAGDAEGALRKYESALALEPTHARAHFNLGVILQSRERLEEAIGHYRDAFESNPKFAPALVNWANAMRQRGDDAEAARLYARALEIDARDPHALRNLLTLAEAATARADKALAREANSSAALALERVLEASPDDFDAHFNLGVALQRLQRFDEAIARYERAVAIQPRHAGALLNLGEALRVNDDPEAARERFEAVLALEPANARALNNLAALALDQGDVRRAEALFQRAADLDPEYAEPRFNLGVIALLRHDFARGWEGCERRFKVLTSGLPQLVPGAARFEPERAGDVVRLAVPREQGIGDQILFSTLLPEIEALDVDADIEVDARLRDAFARSLPRLRFVTPGEAPAAFAGASHAVALGSLPRLFRPSRESFARQVRALLLPDGERAARMAGELPPGPRIAIAWRSFQRRPNVERQKSIPLAEFATLARSGARLLDLQYGDADAERHAFDEKHPGLRIEVPALDRFNDLEGLLAAISLCDCVVTSSNATAHLAGALGKRTFLVHLGAKPTLFYWVPGADGRSLWYPSVEIVADAAWTRWEEAFDAVAARIADGR